MNLASLFTFFLRGKFCTERDIWHDSFGLIWNIIFDIWFFSGTHSDDLSTSFINPTLPHAIHVTVDLLLGVFANGTLAEVSAEFSGANIIRVYDARGKTARRASRIIVYLLFYYRRQDKVGSGCSRAVIFLSQHEICIYNCELHGTPGIIFSAVILVVLLYMGRERYFP